MPGTVKSELLPDADRSHKCDCQEKVSWKRNLPLDKSHFITETDGYYNNSVPPSMIKYATNTFESVYFSKFIASKMLIYSLVKSLLAIIVLISVSWIIANGNILLIIAQAVFSAYIVEDTVYLTIYVNRLNALYDSIYTALITTGVHSSQKMPILLSFCTEYECIKAHYKIRLDSKIFIKYNHELSEKWNTISTHITTD